MTTISTLIGTPSSTHPPAFTSSLLSFFFCAFFYAPIRDGVASAILRHLRLPNFSRRVLQATHAGLTKLYPPNGVRRRLSDGQYRSGSPRARAPANFLHQKQLIYPH